MTIKDMCVYLIYPKISKAVKNSMCSTAELTNVKATKVMIPDSHHA